MSAVVLPVSSASEQNLATKHSEALLTAGAQSWELTPERWVQQQLLRLTLASVLEARLLNVRSGRLADFDLAVDPDTVTLGQLAALQRPHRGTAGQAFELAVADACNAGVAEVAEPLAQALELLGVAPGGPPHLQVLGLEKIPPLRAAEFAEQLRVQLPADGVLRTGVPGRPANVDTVIARLTRASWSSLPKPNRNEPQESQLARADALLTSGSTMVPVSIKINERAVFRPGWAGVPIWVTLGPGVPTRVYRREDAKYPLVEVRLGQGHWSAMFYEALKLLDLVAHQLDLGRPPRVRDPLWDSRLGAPVALQMTRMRSEPVSAVAQELRRVHPVVLERASADTAVDRSVLDVPVLDAAGLHAGWQQEADEGGLFVGQRHLFLPPRSGTDAPPERRFRV